MHQPDQSERSARDAGRRDDDGRPGRRNGAASAAATRAGVGGKLKCLFDELTSGPMPDHLLDLMQELENTLEPERRGPADPAPPHRNGTG